MQGPFSLSQRGDLLYHKPRGGETAMSRVAEVEEMWGRWEVGARACMVLLAVGWNCGGTRTVAGDLAAAPDSERAEATGEIELPDVPVVADLDGASPLPEATTEAAFEAETAADQASQDADAPADLAEDPRELCDALFGEEPAVPPPDLLELEPTDYDEGDVGLPIPCNVDADCPPEKMCCPVWMPCALTCIVPDPKTCETTPDCQEGLVCEEGFCVKYMPDDCASNDDCMPGQICCPPGSPCEGACVEYYAPPCETDDDCPEGEHCCPEGEWCQGTCVEPIAVCDSDDDCPEGLICCPKQLSCAGMCVIVQTCDDNSDCPQGKVCCPKEVVCGGQCIEHCTNANAPPCPEEAPICDPVSGLCKKQQT
jgi:hypothetical protein